MEGKVNRAEDARGHFLLSRPPAQPEAMEGQAKGLEYRQSTAREREGGNMKSEKKKPNELQIDIPDLCSGEVSKLVGVNKTTVLTMSKDGRFPRPVNLTGGERPVWRWFRKDVEAWLKDRMARSGYQPYRPEYLERG